MTRKGVGRLSTRLDIRDNVVFVTPNTHPNELSVLFLLFFLCIAVVVLAFVALFCIGCRASNSKRMRRIRVINQESLKEMALQRQQMAPGSSPHQNSPHLYQSQAHPNHRHAPNLHVMSVAGAVATPAPARLKMPKPMMMPNSMMTTRHGIEDQDQDDRRVLRSRRNDSRDLRALHELHAFHGFDGVHAVSQRDVGKDHDTRREAEV